MRDLSITLKLPGTGYMNCIHRNSDGKLLDMEVNEDGITIQVPMLDTLEMFTFDYG